MPDADEYKADFVVANQQNVRTGHVPLTPQKPFGDMAAGVGVQHFFGDRVRVRFEGNFKRVGLDKGNPYYTRFDYAPIPLDEVNRLSTEEGTLEMIGPSGNWFVDFDLGDSENFLYMGSGISYLRARNQYQLSIGDFSASMDDSDWIRANSFEVGGLFKLRRGLSLRAGYQLNRFESLKFTTQAGSVLDEALRNQHTFKVGIVHFFRKN